MGKVAMAGLGLPVAALLALPLAVGGGGAPASACGASGELAAVLQAIRAVESHGRYDAAPNAGGASGAYQYVGTTWRAWAPRAGMDTGRYPQAYLAPPEVQDAVAAAHAEAIVARHGDIAMVPVVWYWPRAATDPAQMDLVPRREAGNTLTVRAYQARWLAAYDQAVLGGGSLGDGGRDEAGSASCASRPGLDGYALPVDRALVEADPGLLARPHHDYPAADLAVPMGTPVYAVRGGTVDAVTTWAHNCGRERSCPEPCGIGVLVEGDDGGQWTYCHASRLHVALGQSVAAGQLLLSSGNSGRSTGPHLHLGLTAAGARRCPQPLLAAIYENGRGLSAASLPTVGCTS